MDAIRTKLSSRDCIQGNSTFDIKLQKSIFIDEVYHRFYYRKHSVIYKTENTKIKKRKEKNDTQSIKYNRYKKRYKIRVMTSIFEASDLCREI